MLETQKSKANNSETQLTTVSLESKELKKFQMQVLMKSVDFEESAYITGLRFEGFNQHCIFANEWSDIGSWSSPIIVAKDEKIVGVMGNFGPNENIQSLYFIVAHAK